MSTLLALPALLLAGILDDSAALADLDRARALDDNEAIARYAALRPTAADPALATALDLARARRVEHAQGAAAALATLRSTRAPAVLAPALADERLRLARAAGDERALLALLTPRLRHAPRRARPAIAAELVDLALAARRTDTLARVRAALDPARDAELLQVLDLRVAARGRDRAAAAEVAVAALGTLTAAVALQRIDAVLVDAGLWESVRARLSRADRIAAAQRMVAGGRAERAHWLLDGLRDGADSDLARVQVLATQRRHDEALALCEQALRRSPEAARGPLLLEQARLLSRLGRSRESHAAYREFATRFAADPEADRASFFAAWMYHEAGEPQAAARAFAAYLAERPRGASVELARWLLALNLARANEPAACLDALEALLAEVRDPELATPARYLRTRTLRELGRVDEARAALAPMLEGPLAPVDKAPYYRALAASLRARLDRDGVAIDEDALCGARAWLPGIALPRLDSGPPRSPWTDPAAADTACVAPLRAAVRALAIDVPAEPLRGLEAAAAVGLCDVVGRGLRHLGLPRVPAARRRHLEAALLAGDATRALRLAGVHYGARLQEPFSDDSRWLWRLAYPTPPAFVELPATRVHPSLVRAVARHESHFDATARSRVGALGLMQLMPATGARLGDLAGVAVRDETDLLRPATNVVLASRYLELLDGEFTGALPLVLAAYNGGPRNVQGWVERNAALPLDLWVESIPFRETRGYVKKVLAAQLVYAWLDDDAREPAWLRRLCLDAPPAQRVEF